MPNATENKSVPKNYISGEFSHIFEGARVDTNCRILINADNNELMLVGIADGAGFRNPSRGEFEDLLDSLKNANSEVFTDPEDYGLVRTRRAPEWALLKA